MPFDRISTKEKLIGIFRRTTHTCARATIHLLKNYSIDSCIICVHGVLHTLPRAHVCVWRLTGVHVLLSTNYKKSTEIIEFTEFWNHMLITRPFVYKYTAYLQLC